MNIYIKTMAEYSLWVKDGKEEEDKLEYKDLSKDSQSKVHSYLNALNCQDTFSDYFHSETLKKMFSGGFMGFKHDLQSNTLHSITSYLLEQTGGAFFSWKLVEYTLGQLSDGIGEGFEQQPHHLLLDGKQVEMYISPIDLGIVDYSVYTKE